jgi:PKD repeat protein
VGDSLSTWNIGKYTPYAPFTTSLISALNYQFTSYSSTLANKWYFGDGTTSLLINPSHAYAVSQTYTVSHVVTTACKKDSASFILSPIILDVSQIAKEYSFSVFPNPVTKEFSVKSFSTNNISINYVIYDIIGNECLKGITNDVVNVEQLNNGVYFLEIRDDEKLYSFKFIKSVQ